MEELELYRQEVAKYKDILNPSNRHDEEASEDAEGKTATQEEEDQLEYYERPKFLEMMSNLEAKVDLEKEIYLANTKILNVKERLMQVDEEIKTYEKYLNQKADTQPSMEENTPEQRNDRDDDQPSLNE